MKKLWTAIKNYPDVAGYVILSLLIFGACFSAVFAFIASIYVLLFAFFLRNETKILGLILFVYCFFTTFNICYISFHIDGALFGYTFLFLILDILKLVVFLIFLLRVIKKEKKINLKLFIPIVLFLIYMALPMHVCEWEDLIHEVVSYLALYVVFEERNEIKFGYLVRVFISGIIVSCIFGLYYKISPFIAAYISPVWSESGVIRYQGLTVHPMQLAGLALIAISALMLMKHKRNISLLEFFILFVPVFIFGYLTISRTFIITIVVGVLLYLIFELFKRKNIASSFIFFVVIALIIGCVMLIFKDVTTTYLVRFDIAYYESWIPGLEFGMDEEVFKEFLAGNVPAALNRTDMIKYYLMDWSSSPMSILFGRGISRKAIGGLNSHNILIQKIWEHGLIGFVFYLTILICSINWKKLKEIKNYLFSLILIIPFFMFLMVELINFDFPGYVLSLVSLGFLSNISSKFDKNNLDKQNLIDERLLGNVTLSIIIPVYNGEKFIKACVDKVLKIPIGKEVIIINDGSTDNSLNLLKTYGDQIKLINLDENKGVSHARNLGLENANGNYISFIDIDDDFELNMHQKILTKMIKEDADVGMCQYDDINLKRKKVSRTGRLLDFDKLEQSETIKLNLLNKINNTIWNSIYKGELAKSVKFEESIKIGEDRLYQLKVALKAKKTVFVNEDLYHYVRHSASVTKSPDFLSKVDDHLKLLKFLTESEKSILEHQYLDEFQYCKNSILLVSFNLVLRWGLINKKSHKQIFQFSKDLINNDICNYIIKSKFSSLYMKIECRLLKILNLKVFLFCFPFFYFIWKTIYCIAKPIMKFIKDNQMEVQDV